jgi:Eco57I restriction-modification methylase
MRYVAIRSEGGLIPYDLLDKIAAEDIVGQKPADFGLTKGRRLTDEISRVWSDAQSLWDILRRRRETLSDKDPYGTTLTRDRWMVPLLSDAEMFGFDLKLQSSAAVLNNLTFPVSHRSGDGDDAIPVHVEGLKVDLDKRLHTKLRTSPQAMVQEFLNHSEPVLWGIVTNGLTFRILRDSSRTSRPTYLEFDLESILDGNRFAEFAIFYRLCHRSRFPRPGQDPSECLLEQYYLKSVDEGSRVREGLRGGVEETLKIFGNAFLQHPDNVELRDKITDGRLTPIQYHRQLLLLVYRLLFLMVAEERGLIVSVGEGSERNQKIYDEGYSIGRLRDRAAHIIEESPFRDLWIGLLQTFSLFEYGLDANALGIPPLNGDLFHQTHAVPDLAGTSLYNHELLRAVRHLSMFKVDGITQRVNYSALDVEELGSVYESLLDYQPVVEPKDDALTFELRTGTERKSTGSYYTRPELVHELIESALVPVMEERIARAEKESEEKDLLKERDAKIKAILSMTVCDPACGSGHFLLAAARRIGKELARIKTGEDEPRPEDFHLAIRDVIQHCIYGVDMNPLAVDLCKLALWLEGHWAGKPLSFLDHRIKCGNSLIGVLDPEVLEEGIPDDAFTAVTGDDKEVAKAYKKRNKEERKGQYSLTFEAAEHVHEYATTTHSLDEINEETPADVKRKQKMYEDWRSRPDWWHDWTASNIWTAAFFLPLTRSDDAAVPTHDRFLRFVQKRDSQPQMAAAANALAEQLRFFHWRLEFPQVFEQGGFDVVLGNPPWEALQLEEESFFSAVGHEEIAKLPGAERKSAIQRLLNEGGAVAQLWRAHQRSMEAGAVFARKSKRFELTATGKLNTYALFAELTTSIVALHGRTGMLLPIGIATDDSTKRFFGGLVDNRRLASIVGFENEAFIFPSVHHAFKFCALTVTGRDRPAEEGRFVFFCRTFEDLLNKNRWFELKRADFDLLNPNTRNCPTFRTRADAQMTMKLFRSAPVLINEKTNCNPWHVRYKQGLFNMTTDSSLFEQSFRSGALRVYEAKMIHQFDHRWATYDNGAVRDCTIEEKMDFTFQAQPRYWVADSEVATILSDWRHPWLLGFRLIARSVDERTCIFSILPRVGTAGGPLCNIFSLPEDQPLLLANLNCLVSDYVARQKIGGIALNFFIVNQLAIVSPSSYEARDREHITQLVVELTYSSNDLQGFASYFGVEGKPYPWDEGRRAQLRAELDAYYAHLYGLTRDELRYILDPKDIFGDDFPSETFRVLKEREIKECGEYRTQRMVLEAFDKLAESPRFRDEMPKRVAAFEVPKGKSAKA